jgi:hypothetical protein
MSGVNEIMTQGPGNARAMSDILIEPKDCALVLVDQRGGNNDPLSTLWREVISLASVARSFSSGGDTHF